jgi:hypothetical protein
VKIDATITFEAADDTEGRRKLDAIAVITNCQVEDWTMEETWEGGQAILVPRDRFADEDTNPKRSGSVSKTPRCAIRPPPFS